MSESMVDVRPRRGGLTLATIGVALIVIALITALLVLLDKKHFGWMVGTWFLPVMLSGVIAGSLALLGGALMLPGKKRWQVIALIVWALIAATSPLFGWLFLLPWCLLAVTLPVVIVALVQLRRT